MSVNLHFACHRNRARIISASRDGHQRGEATLATHNRIGSASWCRIRKVPTADLLDNSLRKNDIHAVRILRICRLRCRAVAVVEPDIDSHCASLGYPARLLMSLSPEIASRMLFFAPSSVVHGPMRRIILTSLISRALA